MPEVSHLASQHRRPLPSSGRPGRLRWSGLLRLLALGSLLTLTLVACDQPATSPVGGSVQVELQPAELVFSSLLTQPSATRTIILSNPGATRLQLTELVLSGSQSADFELLGVPALPRSIEPGGQLELRARLAAGRATGVRRASLDVIGPGGSRRVALSGLRAAGVEGPGEPPLAQIVDALGYGTDVGSAALGLGTDAALLGAEIRAPLFRRAAPGPVSLRPVARYSPDGEAPYGIFTVPESGGAPITAELGRMLAGEHQALLPAVGPETRTTYDPGKDPFGVYLAPGALAAQVTYTLDSLNSGANRRAARAYPALDRSGKILEHTYLLGFEPDADGEYQDAVFVLENVQPVPAVLGWGQRAAAPITLYEAQGGAVDGQLYVFGGFDRNLGRQPIATQAASRYDPATDRWTALRDIPAALTHAGTAVDGSSIYVAGGFLGDHPGPQTDQFWRYDTLGDTWTALPPLPAARGAGALVRLNRTLHYFGGIQRSAAGEYLQDNGEHWTFPLDIPQGNGTQVWTPAAPLPNPRNHLAGAALGGRIYAIGGQRGGNEASDNQTDVQTYDPGTDTWRAVRGLPLPLSHIVASTTVWRGHLVVVGGVTNATTAGTSEGREVESVLAYDPLSDRWSSLASLPGPSQSPVADVIGDWLIVTTGSTSAGPTSTTWRGD